MISKWIGKDCCPYCQSVSVRHREHHCYCRHCRATFKKPAKREADKRRDTAARAGPAYYRGARWLNVKGVSWN